MGMKPILFNEAKRFEQLIICLHRRPKVYNLGKTGQAVSEKKMFKDDEILYMYIAQGQGQITQEDKILIVTKRVCYFDYT